jgi:hypothetical protein
MVIRTRFNITLYVAALFLALPRPTPTFRIQLKFGLYIQMCVRMMQLCSLSLPGTLKLPVCLNDLSSSDNPALCHL